MTTSAPDPSAAVPVLDFGPLRALLEDPTVTEVMVNGPRDVFAERGGHLQRVPSPFASEAALLDLMQAFARAAGRPLDAGSPMADGRLPDGSRFNAVVRPVAADGPALTIRKFRRDVKGAEDLVTGGTWTQRMATFLSACVRAKANVIVSGGTGAGKTTTLNVLTGFVPRDQRIVMIEDVGELSAAVENRVLLEARPPVPGDPGVSVRALVVNAMRMRPDRVIVGECRAAEAYDMLTAMNTGHEGSMTTIHANSAREALRRLESMVLMAGTEMPLRAVRQHVSSAIHFVVHVARGPDGVRRMVEIVEVAGMEGEGILTQDVWAWTADGGFRPRGLVPRFARLFRERGVEFPQDFFADLRPNR